MVAQRKLRRCMRTAKYIFAPVSLQLCKSQFDLSTKFNHQSFKHGLYKLWIDNNAFEC